MPVLTGKGLPNILNLSSKVKTMNRSGLFEYLFDSPGEPVDLNEFGDEDEYFDAEDVIIYHRLSDSEAERFGVSDSQRDLYMHISNGFKFLVDANGIILY